MSSPFALGLTSLKRLEGVHPDLIRVVVRAIQLTPIDFTVIEGVRSWERQRELYAQGKSKTLNSKHLTGHAVDLAPWVRGAIPWDDWSAFDQVAKAMLQAAEQLGVAIRWGGDWNQNGRSDDETFLDGPHFELVRV